MNAFRNTVLFALSVLVAVLANACVTTVAAAPAALAQGYTTVSPTIVPTSYGPGEVNPHMTGPVSRVCNERNHFEYHNEDRVQCGEGNAPVVEKDNDKTNVPSTSTNVEPETPETPVIVDDGGEDVDEGNDDGGTDVVDDDDDTPVVVDDGGEEPKEDECNKANPGNTKCKGNAGEDPNGRGTMPVDNAGGDGNGATGNSGTNGNAGGNGQSNGNNGNGGNNNGGNNGNGNGNS